MVQDIHQRSHSSVVSPSRVQSDVTLTFEVPAAYLACTPDNNDAALTQSHGSRKMKAFSVRLHVGDTQLVRVRPVTDSPPSSASTVLLLLLPPPLSPSVRVLLRLRAARQLPSTTPVSPVTRRPRRRQTSSSVVSNKTSLDFVLARMWRHLVSVDTTRPCINCKMTFISHVDVM